MNLFLSSKSSVVASKADILMNRTASRNIFDGEDNTAIRFLMNFHFYMSMGVALRGEFIKRVFELLLFASIVESDQPIVIATCERNLEYRGLRDEDPLLYQMYHRLGTQFINFGNERDVNFQLVSHISSEFEDDSISSLPHNPILVIFHSSKLTQRIHGDDMLRGQLLAYRTP